MSRSAITLLEVMIIIVILALLTGILLPAFGRGSSNKPWPTPSRLIELSTWIRYYKHKNPEDTKTLTELAAKRISLSKKDIQDFSKGTLYICSDVPWTLDWRVKQYSQFTSPAVIAWISNTENEIPSTICFLNSVYIHSTMKVEEVFERANWIGYNVEKVDPKLIKFKFDE